jgi:hypothetical protein
VDELHHGACIGCDAAAHAAGLRQVKQVVVHPPIKTDKLDLRSVAANRLVRILPSKDYLARNRDIVQVTDRMLALPSGPERRRGSGTWYTVRYAVQVGKPVAICHRDGTVEERK